MLKVATFVATLAFAAPAVAGELSRIVLNGLDPTLGTNAVADEGEGEPRSIGSYALPHVVCIPQLVRLPLNCARPLRAPITVKRVTLPEA
jgi:hypothetical protein